MTRPTPRRALRSVLGAGALLTVLGTVVAVTVAMVGPASADGGVSSAYGLKVTGALPGLDQLPGYDLTKGVPYASSDGTRMSEQPAAVDLPPAGTGVTEGGLLQAHGLVAEAPDALHAQTTIGSLRIGSLGDLQTLLTGLLRQAQTAGSTTGNPLAGTPLGGLLGGVTGGAGGGADPVDTLAGSIQQQLAAGQAALTAALTKAGLPVPDLSGATSGSAITTTCADGTGTVRVGGGTGLLGQLSTNIPAGTQIPPATPGLPASPVTITLNKQTTSATSLTVTALEVAITVPALSGLPALPGGATATDASTTVLTVDLGSATCERTGVKGISTTNPAPAPVPVHTDLGVTG